MANRIFFYDRITTLNSTYRIKYNEIQKEKVDLLTSINLNTDDVSKKSIFNITNELSAYLHLMSPSKDSPKAKVLSKIIKVLFEDDSFKNEKNQWQEKIVKFQEKYFILPIDKERIRELKKKYPILKLDKKGVIIYESLTYKLLRCEVSDELGINIGFEKIEICREMGFPKPKPKPEERY